MVTGDYSPQVVFAGSSQEATVAKRCLANRSTLALASMEDVLEKNVLQKLTFDFLWLALGTAPKREWCEKVIEKAVAAQSSHKDTHVFISGRVEDRYYEEIVKSIFSKFERPIDVQVDLRGNPDVLGALERYKAVRQVHTHRRRVGTTESGPVRVFDIPTADLRSSAGRLHAAKLAELFGVPVLELGRWIGSKKAALSKTPDAVTIQPKLGELERIARVRELVGGDPQFRTWLRTPRPMLENKSPLDWIQEGRILEVAEFADDAITGQPS